MTTTNQDEYYTYERRYVLWDGTVRKYTQRIKKQPPKHTRTNTEQKQKIYNEIVVERKKKTIVAKQHAMSMYHLNKILEEMVISKPPVDTPQTGAKIDVSTPQTASDANPK